jgi:hypothetical protein
MHSLHRHRTLGIQHFHFLHAIVMTETLWLWVFRDASGPCHMAWPIWIMVHSFPQIYDNRTTGSLLIAASDIYMPDSSPKGRDIVGDMIHLFWLGLGDLHGLEVLAFSLLGLDLSDDGCKVWSVLVLALATFFSPHKRLCVGRRSHALRKYLHCPRWSIRAWAEVDARASTVMAIVSILSTP